MKTDSGLTDAPTVDVKLLGQNERFEVPDIKTLVPTSKLGTANGWSETPLLVEKCEAAGHTRWSRKIGRCLHEHGCDICNYTFKVDSGD